MTLNDVINQTNQSEQRLLSQADETEFVATMRQQYKIGEFVKAADGSYSCSFANLDGMLGKFKHLPIQFTTCKDNFNICNNPGLLSLVGSPRAVGHTFHFSNTGVTSWEGAPTKSETIWANNTQIRTLRGIHKYVKQCNEIWFTDPITDGGVGLLLIRGLKKVNLHDTKLAKLINRYLATPDHDIHDAQEEMIASKMVQYAKL